MHHAFTFKQRNNWAYLPINHCVISLFKSLYLLYLLTHTYCHIALLLILCFEILKWSS